MNMLVIGNGFDLAHGRPTSYSNFLQFLSSVQYTQEFGFINRSSTAVKLEKDCPQAKNYLLSSLEIRRVCRGRAVNSNSNIQEILDYLDLNIWYEYFVWIQKENIIHGKNWIDFEQEIRDIIEVFDHQIKNLYDTTSEPGIISENNIEKIHQFWLIFCKKAEESNLSKYMWFDLINITYQDLEHLIRCLEIYLDDCVVKMPIVRYSPDIKQLRAILRNSNKARKVVK